MSYRKNSLSSYNLAFNDSTSRTRSRSFNMSILKQNVYNFILLEKSLRYSIKLLSVSTHTTDKKKKN